MSTQPPDSASGSDTEEDQRHPTVELLLKFGAVPAAVTYAVLFVAYRNYYDRLGVDPESVGANSAYILARSSGFVLLILVFVAVAAASQLLDRRLSEDHPTRHIVFTKLALSLPFTSFLTFLFSPNLAPALVYLVVFVAAAAQTVPLSLFRKFGDWTDTIVYALIIATGLIATGSAIVSRAHFEADQVLEGCQIGAAQLLAVPVLDVSAPKVTLNWIGPTQQRPTYFSNESTMPQMSGLLVGRGTGEEYVLVRDNGSSSVLRIPSSMAVDRIDLTPSACS